MATFMTLSIRKLHPAIGAEVSGLDLGAPVDSDTRAALLNAFARHHVLVFPGADISDEEHIAFSRNFSTLETFPQSNMGAARQPEIYRVSNVGEDGEILPTDSDTARYQSLTQVWHTDGSYLPVPSLGAVLHGIEVTQEGGETQFANMFRAHDALAEGHKRALEKLKARHSFQYSRALKGLPPMKPEELAKVPPVDQPLVRVHGDGRRSLYLSAPLMECVVGWSEADSRSLFAELVAHATRPDFVYRHKWRPHDVVMWDNRCTMHCVTPYDAATKRRVMHRTALVGTEPVVGVEG